MADEKGFLEQLTGSSVTDDRAAAAAATQQGIQQGDRIFQQQHALGQQAGDLGVGIAGLLGGITGGRIGGGTRGAGFRANFTTAATAADDAQTAGALGIDLNELQTNREIRAAMSDPKYADDGTHASRIRMAKKAVAIANARGSGPALARAMQTLKTVQEEKVEFDKLQATTTAAQAEAVDDQIKTAWKADGTAVSGVQKIKDGVAGLEHVDEAGKLVFTPFGENFHKDEPNKTGLANEPDDVRIRKLVSKEERKVIKNLASSANSALRITDRVLSTLGDLAEHGGVESVIGSSGGLITSIDNFARNINGVISAFAGAGASAANSQYRGSLRARADDAGDVLSKLIELPEGVERTSAAAQQHRANIMEMAYMAARLAEPSNRGLSDNDIKNALARIAGGTSNPQVMVRRFIEMQIDAANTLDFALRLHHGSLGPDVSDSRIDAVLGGKGIPEYRKRKEALFKKYGVSVSPDGRAVFAGEAIGADVQPGEGTDPSTSGQADISTETGKADLLFRVTGQTAKPAEDI